MDLQSRSDLLSVPEDEPVLLICGNKAGTFVGHRSAGYRAIGLAAQFVLCTEVHIWEGGRWLLSGRHRLPSNGAPHLCTGSLIGGLVLGARDSPSVMVWKYILPL